MNVFVAHLAAAILVIHGVLGCCHCHPCDASEHASAGLCADECSGHEHQHEHGDDHSSTDGPCPCRLECPSLFSDLPPQRIQFDAVDFAAPQIALCERWPVDRGEAAALGDPFFLEPAAYDTPLRLHLALQILLI